EQIHILHYQYEKPWQAGPGTCKQLRPLIDLWQAFATGNGIPAETARLAGPGEWTDQQAS
ncbi:MAG: glycosyl transferase, partial [Pseudomonadota bacterium]